MSNRTQEENDALILTALRNAGTQGLTIEEVRLALFGSEEQSKSLIKKMLERLKTKGYLRIRMDRDSHYYVILPGR